jgi:hypothetical protein
MKEKINEKIGLGLMGTYKFTSRDKNGDITKQATYKNQIVAVGRGLMAKAISDGGVDMKITHCAIGTGDTAVSDVDDKLVNEGFRKTITSPKGVGNKAVLTTFFTHSEGNMVIKEIGLFIGATDTADSGTLFSRVSTANAEIGADGYTKDAGETLTIEYILEINNI